MQVSNPFDDKQGLFYLLQNDRQQFSLWPAQCTLPAGWRVMCEPQSQDACNAWLSERWTTLIPAHYATGEHAS